MAKILTVEDEGILAKMTRMDMEVMGHGVSGIADNGEKAVEIILRERPEVILTDLSSLAT